MFVIRIVGWLVVFFLYNNLIVKRGLYVNCIVIGFFWKDCYILGFIFLLVMVIRLFGE